MTPAIILALASALCYGLGLTLTQFGLRDVPPASGAAISIPTSALLFVDNFNSFASMFQQLVQGMESSDYKMAYQLEHPPAN